MSGMRLQKWTFASLLGLPTFHSSFLLVDDLLGLFPQMQNVKSATSRSCVAVLAGTSIRANRKEIYARWGQTQADPTPQLASFLEPGSKITLPKT